MLTTNANDVLIGVGNADAFTGTTATDDDGDIIVDGVQGDADTFTLTATATTAALTTVNVENIIVNQSATSGALSVNAANFRNVEDLTVNRTDVSVGGVSIASEKSVAVTGLDAAQVGSVTAGAGTTTVTVGQVSTAGVTVNADTASGNVSVTGAATVNAAGAGAGDTVTVTAGDNDSGGAFAGVGAVQNSKAVNVTTGAETVVIANDATTTAESFTGSISVVGATTQNVTVAAGSGGVTVDVLGETGTVGTDGVVIAGIDDSGASVTTSYVGTATAKGVVSVDGSGTTDVATVSAAGVTTLATAATNQIETLNLSGNGSAVTFEVAGAATTYNLSGDFDITLSGGEASFDGKTVSDTSSGVSTIEITTLDDSDLSKAVVDNIVVSSNVASKTLTLADNATVTLATDVTTAFAVAGKAAGYTVNLATADDTDANGTVIDITTGTLTASSNITTLNLDASVGKFTATTATTASATTDINVSGTKDVDLGNLTAKSLTSTSTGAISLDAANVGLVTVTTGAGDDTIVMDVTTAVVTVSTGAGADQVTVDSEAGSVYATGEGNDIINLNTEDALVINAGDGNDNVRIADDKDSDAIIVGGDGVDTLTFLEDSVGTVAARTNFAISGFEIIDITAGGVTMNASQFAGNNAFQLVGDSAAEDVLFVTNTGTSGAVIDASNVTFASTQNASLNLTGKASLQDTITGSSGDDVITATTGGDVIDAGAGLDTFLAAALAANNIEGGTSDSTGVVVNLGSVAITNTAVLSGISGFTADTVSSVGGGEVAYVFAASGATNSAVISSLVNVENVIGTAGADYILGSSGDNALDGGVGADFISAGLGNDTITGGEGADNLTGGLGADTFVFAATVTNDTTAADATVGLNEEAGDIITGFDGSTDTIQFAASVFTTNSSDGTDNTADAGTGGFTEISASADVSANSAHVIFEITGTGDITVTVDAAAVAALLSGATVDSGAEIIFAVDDGTDSYLWLFDASTNTGGASTDGTVDAAELSLVAKIIGVTDFAADDFNLV